MDATRTWTNVTEGCAVLAALSVSQSEPRKAEARSRARLQVRHSLLDQLKQEMSFSDETAEEIVEVMTQEAMARNRQPGSDTPISVPDDVRALPR
jgi:type II secretory pathway component PulK